MPFCRMFSGLIRALVLAALGCVTLLDALAMKKLRSIPTLQTLRTELGLELHPEEPEPQPEMQPAPDLADREAEESPVTNDSKSLEDRTSESVGVLSALPRDLVGAAATSCGSAGALALRAADRATRDEADLQRGVADLLALVEIRNGWFVLCVNLLRQCTD